MGFFLGFNRWRIAAAGAAAAAAAFEEAGIFPLCGGNGFPMHARRFDLRCNVVRILWTILVVFHGGLGRFEVHIVEVLFLLAQFLNRNSPSTNFQHSSENSREYSMMVFVLGYWFSRELFGNEIMLLSRLMSFSITNFSCVRESLMTKIFSYVHIRQVQNYFLTWGNNIVLSNSPRECTYTSELVDVHQCNKVDFPCCCAAVWHSFIPCPLLPLHLESTLLGVKDLLFTLLGFPRGQRLWKTDLQNCLNHS